jgi:hypothetical protein
MRCFLILNILFISVAQAQSPSNEVVNQLIEQNSSAIVINCQQEIKAYSDRGVACNSNGGLNSGKVDCLQFLFERATRTTRDFDNVMDCSKCQAFLKSLILQPSASN